MLVLALIAGIIYLFSATQKKKSILLEHGVDNDDLAYFSIFLWLYALPPIARFLFIEEYSTPVALLFTVSYLPGIVMSRRIAKKPDRGFDYVRKAGREFDMAMWLGVAGIALVVLNWIMWFIRSALHAD